MIREVEQDVEQDPIQNDARKARRKRRSGSICLICGAPNPQGHHGVGHNNDPDLLADLCAKCHKAQHERLRITGVSMQRPDNVLETIILILKGLGTLFDTLSIAGFRWSQALESFVCKLDQFCPGWREVTSGL